VVVALNSGTVSHLIYEIQPRQCQRRRLVSRYDANTAVLSARLHRWASPGSSTETLLERP
jgi:hypothetical protein